MSEPVSIWQESKKLQVVAYCASRGVLKVSYGCERGSAQSLFAIAPGKYIGRSDGRRPARLTTRPRATSVSPTAGASSFSV